MTDMTDAYELGPPSYRVEHYGFRVEHYGYIYNEGGHYLSAERGKE